MATKRILNMTEKVGPLTPLSERLPVVDLERLPNSRVTDAIDQIRDTGVSVFALLGIKVYDDQTDSRSMYDQIIAAPFAAYTYRSAGRACTEIVRIL